MLQFIVIGINTDTVIDCFQAIGILPVSQTLLNNLKSVVCELFSKRVKYADTPCSSLELIARCFLI